MGEYQEKYGGLVLSLAINLRQRISLVPTKSNTIFTRLPMSLDGDESFYRTFLDEFKVKNVVVETDFDGEITGGIGSSASAAVATIGAINKYKGLGMTLDQIAERAWDIEVNKLGLFGGKQDQYAAAYGGLNAIQFENKVIVTPLGLGLIEPIYPYILLFHTPNRKSPKIQEGLQKITGQQKQALDFIKGSVVNGLEYLRDRDVTKFGDLLKQCWEAKKVSNNVTTDTVDELYEKAISLGALGGKLMGSGGGGYMFFLVEPDSQDKFKKQFCTKDVKWVDFGPDTQGLETRIV